MAARWQRSLVAVRTFLGIVYLSNGLAKLFGFSSFSIGPWNQYLFNRAGARSVLASNVHNGGIGPLRDFATGFVLPHWHVLSWVVTAGELAVGIGLLLGLLGRLAATGGLAMSLLLFLWSLGVGAWTYDYLFEPVLLAVLALTPGLPGVGPRLLARWFPRAELAPAASSRGGTA